jgi:hypothetical protein
MHWFDRMSKQFAAAPPTATRRSMLRGTAVAVAVAPFAPGALAYANRRLKRADSTEDCINCLSRSAGRTAAAVARCKAETPKAETASSRHLLLKPKGGGGSKGSKGGKGGKAKKGMKPTEAAKRAACMGRAAERFLEESDNCTKIECAGLGETAPRPVAPGAGGGSGCPSGTKLCSGSLCCYGEDNCCPCASVDGGSICCAAVIQCGCC